MRKLLFCALFFITSAAAQPVNLDMQQVNMQEFTQAVIKSILDKDYVISSDVELSDRKLSVQLKNQTPEQLLTFLRTQLKNDNLDLVDREGVLYVEKIQSNPDTDTLQNNQPSDDSQSLTNISQKIPTEFFIYKSRHRPLTEFNQFFTSVRGSSGAGGLQSVTIDNDLALVRGRPEFVNMAKSVLYKYDRPIDEIEVKASIVEYSTTDQTTIGIFSALKLLEGKLNISIGNNLEFRDFISIKTSTFNAVLSAISNDSHFNILESSTIRLVSGKVGRINVGQEVPVLGQLTFDANGRPIQSVSYRPSGLLVDIKPFVVGENVHAEINQQLSSFAQTQTSNIDSPTLLNRQLSTSLTAPFNQVVLIGGLDEQKDTLAAAKLFGLTIGKNDVKTKTSLFLILEFSRR